MRPDPPGSSILNLLLCPAHEKSDQTWRRSPEDAAQAACVYKRLQRGLLAHLVFDRRGRFMQRDTVAQAKERTLHDDVCR